MRAQLIVLGLLVACATSQHHFGRPHQGRPGPAVHRQGPPSDDKCALLIPSGAGSTCVSLESVERAFATAADELRFVPAKNPNAPTEAEIDLLGRTLVETSRILAAEFKLPLDAIHSGLPLIDTKTTSIGSVCPAPMKNNPCKAERFRSIDGTCNNLENSHWGAAMSPFRRLLPPAYADGVSDPRVSVTGEELPTPRAISSAAHRDLGLHDHAVTILLPSWGQMVDHDIARGVDTIDPKTGEEPKCCDVAPNKRHPACLPIDIPKDDPFFSLFRRQCLEFVRTATALKDNCRLGARSTLNGVSSYIDASHVYGLTDETAKSLREFRGGLLKSQPLKGGHKGLKELPPPRTENPDQGCRRPSKNVFCFLTGDPRANQQMMLASMHILLLREHNRIARELSKINPRWDDERLFQETRRIIGALVQHVTYNEMLPMVLGKDIMDRYDLLPLRDGMLKGYNPKLDAGLPVSFFAAAYRFGHSLIPSALERWSPNHKFVSGKRLSEGFNQPFEAYEPGVCDQYMIGFTNQISQAFDVSMSQELTNHLFPAEGAQFGTDLASLNMQRGREHGVPGYNAFREMCGMKRARDWNDLNGVFTNNTLQKYASLYNSVDDIDLWSAGISEKAAPGSMVGPIFGCIMGHTFKNLRFGDRFWYENAGEPSSFTLEQVNEIRKVRLSRMLCDNSDDIETIQVYAMVLPDHEINPRVPCKSSVLGRMNLAAWKE